MVADGLAKHSFTVEQGVLILEWSPLHTSSLLIDDITGCVRPRASGLRPQG